MGLSVDDLMGRARGLADRLGTAPITELANNLRVDEHDADVLQALFEIVREAGESDSEWLYRRVCSGYELVDEIPWEEEIGERSDLLASFALVAWRHCRRFRTYREMTRWEARCVEHTLAQAHVRDFLSLRCSEISDGLARRFLADPAIVLSLRNRFENERNKDFAAVGPEAASLCERMDRLKLPADDEERAFFQSDIALSAGLAYRYLGEFRVTERWLSRSRGWLSAVQNRACLDASLRLAELNILGDRHRLDEVAAKAPELRKELLALGMDWSATAAGLLYTEALKENGRLAEAKAMLLELAESPTTVLNPLAEGVIAAHGVEIALRLGHNVGFVEYTRARDLLEKSGAKWALAHFHALAGDYFRDRSQYDQAIDAYEGSIRSYEATSMKAWAAYVRLLLAEVFIANDMPEKAVREISLALPVAKQESIEVDIMAGVSLLQEAIRRAGGDSRAQSKLRDELKRTLGLTTQT